MIKKNDVIVGLVTDTGVNGEGVIKQDGFVIFVPFSLVGEKVKCHVLKTNKKFAYAKVIEVLTPAMERIRPSCPVFSKCGGCLLQHVKYSEQLKIKEKAVINCFNKIAGIEVDLLPTYKSPLTFRYRNKLQLPIRANDKGGYDVGFFAENSHRVVPIDDCLINPEWTKSVIIAIREYIDTFGIKAYDEKTDCGELKEITVKDINGSLIITLVSTTTNLKDVDKFIEIAKKHLKYEFSVYLNVNCKQTNVIYGDEFRLLYGKPHYSSSLHGVSYKIGVQSFMQVNPEVCSKLYASVKETLGIDENTIVFDAYSGAGLMTAIVAKDAKKAIGIEIIKEAVDCANELAQDNYLQDKITNYCGKCEDILPDLIEKEKGNGRICVVLDPPRKGCDRKVVEAVKNSGADVIAYVSCMPSTLARDVGILTENLVFDGENIVKNTVEKSNNRYQVQSVKLFDMFAQTKHVETLVVLTRKN